MQGSVFKRSIECFLLVASLYPREVYIVENTRKWQVLLVIYLTGILPIFVT